MKSTSRTTVRKVAKGTFRVSNKSTRSAVSGKFVSKSNSPSAATPKAVQGKKVG